MRKPLWETGAALFRGLDVEFGVGGFGLESWGLGFGDWDSLIRDQGLGWETHTGILQEIDFWRQN